MVDKPKTLFHTLRRKARQYGQALVRAKLLSGDWMKHFFSAWALLVGSAVALALTAVSFALAFFGMENLYYVSVFLPVAMFGCLGVAWFMVLRNDGFAGRGRASDCDSGSIAHATGNPGTTGSPGAAGNPGATGSPGAAGSPGHAGSPGTADMPVELSLFAPRDGGLVERRKPGQNGETAADSATLARAALVWAAIELGGLAAILYSAAGLGSRYHL